MSRSAWMSASSALAVTVFGGFAPYVATWLIAGTGNPMAPAFSVIAAAAVSFPVIATLPEAARRPLA